MGQSPFDVEGKMLCQTVGHRQPPAVALWQSAVVGEWTYHQYLIVDKITQAILGM